jgi:hypothetical protein
MFLCFWAHVLAGCQPSPANLILSLTADSADLKADSFIKLQHGLLRKRCVHGFSIVATT